MRTFLLLLVTALASASRESYAPAKFISPLPYAIQPRQDVESKTFYPFTSGEKVEQGGVVVQTGDWYKVDPASRGLFALSETQATIAKVLVGTFFLAALLYLILSYTNVLKRLSTNPDVAELIAAIENKIPKEARSLENLAGLAEMAFNSIDKYAKMNE